MYESPIELLFTDIHHQIVEQQDEQIYQAVMHFVPNVNREELLRALKYDRGQYDKGYADGVRDSEPKWIPVTERLPEQYHSVIVWTSDKELGEAAHDGERFCWTADDEFANVTHWMPLPEPPKEGEQNE